MRCDICSAFNVPWFEFDKLTVSEREEMAHYLIDRQQAAQQVVVQELGSQPPTRPARKVEHRQLSGGYSLERV